MKTRKIKKKRFCLPKEIQNEIKKKKLFQKQLQSKMQNGERDVELERKLKKHQNFVNKKIKSFVRGKTGQNISSESNAQEIWKSVNDILRPQKSSHNNLKIETEDKLIEEPLQVAEKFSVFFKEKIEKLVEGIKNNNLDPLSKLKTKFQAKDLKFKVKTVSENKVLQILK